VYSYPCPKLIPFDAIVSGTELFSAAEEGNSWKPYEKLPAPPCNIFSSLSPVDTSAVLHCREEREGSGVRGLQGDEDEVFKDTAIFEHALRQVLISQYLLASLGVCVLRVE
jgi:hypothetical protein